MRDVLEHCGIKKDAVYTAYYGKDTHLSGDLKKDAISRGVPIAKALSKRRGSGERFTRALMFLERLERLPTRYLSAHYVAARAIRKPTP